MKPFSALSAAGRGVARQGDRRLFACEDGRRLYAPGAAARPRDLATELRSAPRLEARPCPPVPPAPSTPALSLLRVSSPSHTTICKHRQDPQPHLRGIIRIGCAHADRLCTSG